MAKEQLGARVDEDIAKLARSRAADRGVSLGDYLAQLVREDVEGIRRRSLAAAARFLEEHGSVFDEAQDAQRSARGVRSA